MDTLPLSEPVRTGEIAGRRPRSFRMAPDAATRASLAPLVGATDIGALRFEGELRPTGRGDVTLQGRLTARVTQPCVVTLAPVETRIDEEVTRRYLADMPEPEGEEVEMPEDETAEQLPVTLDLAEVMAEALALAMPLYPRAPGAALGPEAGEPEPEEPETNRPFAGLKGLLGQAGNGNGPDDGKDNG